jgi:segregation and condensation protein A
VAHEVRLEVFEGPIDLLLHLVTRQRVDIYDVSLATITDEYLHAVERMDSLDLETTTGFLVVAAALLELKSARLLPSPDSEENDGFLEQRDLLLARLVECATFREAGRWVSSGLERGLAYHGRTAGLEPQFLDLAPDLLARVSPTDLAAAAAAALYRPPPPELDTTHVTPIKATVAEAILELARGLSIRSTSSFRELCAGLTNRIDVVVRFLGILELYKSGAVDLSQSDRFGDIAVTWTGEVGVEDALENAEEYSLPEGAR